MRGSLRMRLQMRWNTGDKRGLIGNHHHIGAHLGAYVGAHRYSIICSIDERPYSKQAIIVGHITLNLSPWAWRYPCLRWSIENSRSPEEASRVDGSEDFKSLTLTLNLNLTLTLTLTMILILTLTVTLTLTLSNPNPNPNEFTNPNWLWGLWSRLVQTSLKFMMDYAYMYIVKPLLSQATL